mmetsp:Transcript_32368/g.73923  ORF Transcript_32368/g.73923 Transcript_32368/m.73923 type:complete len:233 (-) Transcript_32368:542-1240(-)
MTAHHVQQHLAVDGIDLLGQLGVLVERALDGGPVLVVDERDKLLPLARDLHRHDLVLHGRQPWRDLLELADVLERSIPCLRVGGRIHRLAHRFDILGDAGSGLASADQGLEPHNAVERSKVPHSRVRPAHDGLDPHGRGDEDGVHLLVEQPIDVGAVRPLDDRRRSHHARSEFAAVFPRLDAADDALDGRRAPSEHLGAKLLDSLECLPAEEDLGPSHLEAGHGAPAREVEG